MNKSILDSILDYNSISGNFIWKVKPSKKVSIGDIAGTITNNGYFKIRFLGKEYLAHRLAWLSIYGDFPEGILDHIDQDKLNNSINNLREVSISENGHNTKIYSTNKSGYKNIFWDKTLNKYSVKLCKNNIKYNIGTYHTLEGAKLALDTFIELKKEFQDGNSQES